MRKLLLLPLLGLLLTSCGIHTNYVGKSYAPTIDPDLYFSWNDVKKEYETMGYINATPQNFATIEDAQAAIEKAAREKGADAVVFTDFNNQGMVITQDVQPNAAGGEIRTTTATKGTDNFPASLKAAFIKYK